MNKRTGRKLWAIIPLGLITLFMLYCIVEIARLASDDYSGILPYVHPYSDENAAWFWGDIFLLVIAAEILAVCVTGLVSLVRNNPSNGPLFSAKSRRVWFVISAILLAVLVALSNKYGTIFKESYSNRNYFAYYDANRYFPLLIGTEFDIGFIILLFTDRIRQIRIEKKHANRSPE